MIYKINRVFTPEILNMRGYDDELILKELAMKLIMDMPIEEIKKIISFNKIDPNSKESKAKLLNPDTPKYEKDTILDLKTHELIRFEASYDTKPEETCPGCGSEDTNLYSGFTWSYFCKECRNIYPHTD